jgi:nucleoside-diphosphate-sugar epimerase
MKVLITGVAGFIGSNFASEILRLDYEVVGVDCITSNYAKEIKSKNLLPLLKYKNFSFLEVDLLETNLEGLLLGIDTVFHFAGHPSVHSSWGSDFSTYSDRNVVLTQNLLKASLDKGVRKFINSSSSSVYGRIVTAPTKESDPVNPVSPYGVTKLAAENLVTLYGKEFGLETVSLRYFTVYGPRQRPDMAFSKLINCALMGLPFELHGDGSQIRDFTYVEDVVKANLLALKNTIKPGEIFNIGGGAPVTMTRVMEIIEQITKSKINLVRKEMGPGNPMVTSADCTKASALMGWNSSIGIEAGIANQIDGHRSIAK